jgi:hypothetical protein
MKLYKATYATERKSRVYILAPDFQTAVRLAEADTKRSDASNMKISDKLLNIELLDTEVIQE